ncbi:response regulator transcription factor [Halanaerobacter jeridensis]|uniref:Stage 0 sporulation protein A homolog n=1 Tax=Halanaerobacter jeridensis TaxID=706427 RepID=A0A939BR93_9FIRM|nr:response regulator [Halanaerobacter jeridensis]MBM7555756.1 DNA-binding response OmpR family regulator [Halanaerobacter jeridensis]
MDKILLVEDNKNIAKVLKMCLTKADYEVKRVANGTEAVDEAYNWKPALILLDIKIPKMNGFLVCETLKDDDATANIPIIMLSAKAEEEDIQRAYDLGATDYLIKPIEPQNLLKKIKEQL